MNNITPMPRRKRVYTAQLDASWTPDLVYMVEDRVCGRVFHDDDGFTWYCPRFNSTGHCATLERAKWWVVHYTEKT